MEWAKGIFIITLGISLVSLALFLVTGFPFLFFFLAFPPFIFRRKKKLDPSNPLDEVHSCPKCGVHLAIQKVNFCPNCGVPLDTR
ncbi:MAG: hypothetical protein ACW976_03815 [Candidatus Ranarchaeia archaeon]|jgi:hypothetical protein